MIQWLSELLIDFLVADWLSLMFCGPGKEAGSQCQKDEHHAEITPHHLH